MIPRECKRLAEVDFPIAEVSRHSAREKSIRHGHPSTLRLWWARRPLAACRAMLLALLLPDPGDPECPKEFKEQPASSCGRRCRSRRGMGTWNCARRSCASSTTSPTGLADGFYAFVQNLTVAMTGTTHGALVLSLPRSQVEMTEADRAWQDRISKVVRRVAKDLIATDETEVSEIIRRRLFETIGREPVIRTVAKQYAAGASLDVTVGFELEVDAATADHLVAEIRQILADLSLLDRIRID